MSLSRFQRLARRLAFLLGLGTAACGTNQPLPPSPSPSSSSSSSPSSSATLDAQVAAGLARLRGLEIVEVRDLVLHLPDAAHACYGPCPTDVWNDMVAAEYNRQLPRLDRLTQLADQAVHNSYPVPLDASGAAAEVAALNALAIVDLGDLLTVQPANNPTCYNTPCPEDVQRAKSANELRAFYLHVWATAAGIQKP